MSRPKVKVVSVEEQNSFELRPYQHQMLAVVNEQMKNSLSVLESGFTLTGRLIPPDKSWLEYFQSKSRLHRKLKEPLKIVSMELSFEDIEERIAQCYAGSKGDDQ